MPVQLSYYESKLLLEKSGIPVAKGFIVKEFNEVIKRSETIHYPVVIKALRDDFTHKSDSGAIQLGIQSLDDLKKSINTFLDIFGKSEKFQGIMIEEQVTGTELIIGIFQDPEFGHLIAFGIGGTMVEIYKDVSYRLIPINRIDAEEMIEEIIAQKVFAGFRGKPPIPKEPLIDILLKINDFIIHHKEILEMDINPMFATATGLVAVDYRITINT